MSTSPDEDNRLSETIVRDEGVLLGYVSSEFYGRQFANTGTDLGEFLDDPIAPPDSTSSNGGVERIRTAVESSEIYDPESGASPSLGKNQRASYDPLARELYVSGNLEKKLSNECTIESSLARSVVNAHEAAHSELANQEFHQYGYARILTFVLTLLLFQGRSHSESFFTNQMSKLWHITSMSELTQEMIALKRQKRYLSDLIGTSYADDWERAFITQAEAALPAEYRKSFKRDANVNNPDEISVSSVSIHAVATWLYHRFLNTWDIDIIGSAFRFWNSNKGEIVSPDVTVMEAAAIDENKIKGCDSREQWDIWLSRLNEADISPDSFLIAKSQKEDVNPKLPNICQKNSYQQNRQENFDIARDRGWIAGIPLWARSYPGKSEGRTLHTVLTSMYVSKRYNERRLFIDSNVFQWAKRSKLLRLAMELWELRELTVLPIIRLYRRSYRYATDSVGDLMIQPLGNPQPRYLSEYSWFQESLDDVERIKKAIDIAMPTIRKEYNQVLRDLRILGSAIINENNDTVDKYF